MSEASSEVHTVIEGLSQATARAVQTRNEHVKAVHALLDTVAKEPTGWRFEIDNGDGSKTHGPVSAGVVDLLRAMININGLWTVAGGAGCADRNGCATIGGFGGHCMYLCKVVGAR